MASSKKKECAEVHTEIMIITPAMASEWLSISAFDNRRLDDRNVEKLVRDIKNKKWVFDGNPIRFDKKNNILDGQHRLWAIVKSGKEVESLVIRGLEDESKFTIDTGKARTNSDVLHFAGYLNAAVVAAACRLSIGYRLTEGDMWKWSKHFAGRRLTPQDILVEAQGNEELMKGVYEIIRLPYTKKIMGAGLGAFVFYLISSSCKDDYAVQSFFHGLETGTRLEENNPILVLRHALVTSQMMIRHKGGSDNRTVSYKLAIIIKAWNAHRSGKTIQRLLYLGDKETFPTPKA